MNTPSHLDHVLDVVIVGAGFGGLYAIHKLRQQGMNVRAFEAGDGVGGHIFWFKRAN